MKILKSEGADVRAAISDLRRRLSILEGQVSQASEKKTKKVFGRKLSPQEAVLEIVRNVRERGDEALVEYTKKLDGVTITVENLRVPKELIEKASETVSKDFLSAIRVARENIVQFQEHIRIPQPTAMEGEGRTIGVRYAPIASVACYVPGGSAPLASTVLMTCVPAQVAGVGRIVVLTPPQKDGTVAPEILAACNECGVTEVYPIGGAQAIAALAFGTKTITPVDKIVGPGNIFVTLAKKEVLGQVGIDILAGPSEVLIIADDTAPAEFVAADLLSQAEHYPGAAILLTTSERLATDVAAELDKQVSQLTRAAEAKEALDSFGLTVVAESIEECVQLANELAPEHLEIMVKDADAVSERIRNAGAIFVGLFTPEPVGDYIAGPSHVLPTGGTARFFSGLSVNDFLRRTSVMSFSQQALTDVTDKICTIAESESLDAHANACKIRSREK